jgi:dihydroorotate dehydrogenase (NAD+) catalytic subunit
MTAPDLSVKLGNLSLQNPVMTASGTFGYGKEFKDLVDLDRLGGVIVKGLSLLPSKGNPPPRIAETPCGMLNAIGLENVGLEAFLQEKVPFLKTLKAPVLANVYGTDIDSYSELAARLSDIETVAGIEVNISCPNVKQGGIAFGSDPATAYEVTRTIRARYDGLVMVKLSPNVTDITQIAVAVADGGADSISLINTITGMAIDIKTRKPKIANITGGLSGPAIRPVAVRMVWQVAQAVSLPLVGIGGIMTAADALEFIIAGATAVQVGTANFINPRATEEIIDGIERYLIEHRIASVQELRGSMATD